jgi:hypothetical protein
MAEAGTPAVVGGKATRLVVLTREAGKNDKLRARLQEGAAENKVSSIRELMR